MRFFPYSSPYKKTGGLINVFLVGGFSVLLFYYCPTAVRLVYYCTETGLRRGRLWSGKCGLEAKVFKMKGF